MHDIWNPWHGCRKVSTGCRHCYMFELDQARGRDFSLIQRNASGFDYPLQRTRQGGYRVRSGEMIRVCMASDFFLEEADAWREEAWAIIHARSDVKFFLLTKRPEHVSACLPSDWGNGWENVFFNVSCENQQLADVRIPLLFDLPFRHKGIMCAPLVGPIDLHPYLANGQIEQVVAGGENYAGSRPCDFDWITAMRQACEQNAVNFCFIETGANFIKNGRLYHLPEKRLQSEMAWKSGISFTAQPMRFHLRDSLGFDLAEEDLYRPRFGAQCQHCGTRPICNGNDGGVGCS
jgi:protein gp37